ncbi:MAG TPA: motility protein A, partial [Firmicutes bacterium]|nr:motility protein A [Bacillota bacterium]
MDLSLILGLVLGFGLLITSIALSGNVGTYWDVQSVMITLGGSMAAVMVNFSLKDLANVGQVLKVLLTNRESNPQEIIATIVRFAEISRREGLLALEERAQELDEPFLQKGIQLVVDGTDPELVRGILEIELSYMEERHEVSQRIFEQMGAYCPAFGMTGTLIGLIMMLQKLDDPSTLGIGMAVALITTLYGVILANLVFLPIADRLRL